MTILHSKMTILHHNQLGYRNNQLGSRHYSKVKDSQPLILELLDTVSILHLIHQPIVFHGISDKECEDMLEDILLGRYQFSPILVQHMGYEEHESFAQRDTVVTSAYLGLLRYYPKKKEGYLTFSRPSTEKDVLFIHALEEVLFLDKSAWGYTSLDSLLPEYFSEIKNGMKGVNRIYRLEIDYPPEIGHFLEKIYLLPKTLIYQYITSFWNLSYIDENGMCPESLKGTYTVSDIRRIVMNLILTDIFDDEFRKVYPGVVFTRFVSQVIIGTKESDEVLFNEEKGYALLKSLGLTGKIHSIARGDSPFTIYRNFKLGIK